MKQVHYNMTKGFLQAAAGTAAAAFLFASWPGAARAAITPEETRIFDNGPEAVEYLKIPAREVPGAGREDVKRIDNERRIALKLARWENAKADTGHLISPAAEAADSLAANDPQDRPLLTPATPQGEAFGEAYTETDLELLAITIYSEAGSDSISDETRRMVGEVVLNRVADERYPDTIVEVLTQRGQYGRFYWTGVVWPARADRTAEAHAVERAYDCARQVFEGERLLPEDVVYQAGFRQGHECVAHAPDFYFCR